MSVPARLIVARVAMVLVTSLAAGASAATCTAGPREEPAGASTSTAARGDTAARAPAPALPLIEGLFVLDSIGSDALPAALPRSSRPAEVLAESIWLHRDGSFTSRTITRETSTGGRAGPPYSVRDSGRHRRGPPDGAIILTGPGSDASRSALLRLQSSGRVVAENGAVPFSPGGTGGGVDWTYRRVPPRRD